MSARIILSLLFISTLFFGCKKDDIDPKNLSFFIKYYGETENDVAYDLKVVEDGFIFAGYTTSVNGDKDAYIVKTDVYGNIVWSSVVDHQLDDEFKEIYLSDQIYVVGTTEDSIYGKDILLQAYSYNGEFLAEKIYYELEDQEGNSIGISGSSILLAGSDTKANNVALGAATGTNPKGVKDFYVLKVNKLIDNDNGVYFPYQDHFQAGGSSDDEITSITIKDGQILASGRLNFTDQGGGVGDLGIDNDNIAIINLPVNALDVPPYDAYGTEKNDLCKKVIFNDNGELIIVGGQNNIVDPFILKIDDVSRLGEPDLNFSIDFIEDDVTIFNDVSQTEDGGYIITGSTDGKGNGAIDVLLLKVDATGKEEWHKTYGGAGDEIGYAAKQTDDGGYIVLATTKAGVGTDLSDQEIMLLKVTAEGELK